MTDPYTAAEATAATSTVWALIAAVVLLTAVAAMHAPELRRRLTTHRCPHCSRSRYWHHDGWYCNPCVSGRVRAFLARERRHRADLRRVTGR